MLKKLAEFKRKKGTAYFYIVRDYDVVVYEERPACDDAKEQAKREAHERMKARANHEREVAAGFKEMCSSFFAELSLKHHEDDAIRFVIWAMTRNVYQSCPMRGGLFLFDCNFVPSRAEKPESYTGSIVISADEICQIPKRELLLGAVMAAYDRISQTDMTMLDGYSGKPKEHSEIIHGLYFHMERMGYAITSDEQAWLDGTHECYSYPHDESEVSS